MSPLMRRCLDCGQLSPNTRCGPCTKARQKIRNDRRVHLQGDYKTRAAKVRAEAEICWLCGGGEIPGDPWQADHVIPGDPNSELRASHRSCNSRRGNGTAKTSASDKPFHPPIPVSRNEVRPRTNKEDP